MDVIAGLGEYLADLLVAAALGQTREGLLVGDDEGADLDSVQARIVLRRGRAGRRGGGVAALGGGRGGRGGTGGGGLGDARGRLVLTTGDEQGEGAGSCRDGGGSSDHVAGC
ncbi:hypothetical protein FEK31_12245 [Nocardia cyriacigeorgica]|nr:hypothetical protein C5B73_27230 [Nocardia cyriacigeorgica]PPJ06340.1 hypothetical protein C5E43_20100 [Nocardia cyriacigeorgica]TLF57802.1 hypothetical protein FEK31_12245 [Nocardia cyriacigeorgica]